ncbi:ethylene-responsive transcription factor 15-like [Macadamia integrifolia]|uniref:ethylene-responsive transcription factor 15-like n=1 Tax=Macadamia integrifolia TaxID=60698 RepID=UPI001C4F4B12|nr:ethylene-responsive transcription factor 15-like [Macadamia integrifolia]
MAILPKKRQWLWGKIVAEIRDPVKNYVRVWLGTFETVKESPAPVWRDDDPDWPSSHKYEVVRGLAEKLINENLHEGFETLREVNRAALSRVFSKTRQLEATMSRQQEHRSVVNGDGDVGSGQLCH